MKRRELLASMAAGAAASLGGSGTAAAQDGDGSDLLPGSASGWSIFGYNFRQHRSNPGGTPLAVGGEDTEELWMAGEVSNPDPVLADGTVYGGFDDGVRAIDAETGEVIWWEQTLDSVDASPAVVDGTVYAGTARGVLLALNAATGERRWKTRLEGGVTASITATLSTVFVGTENYIYSIDASKGTENWSDETNVPVSAPPVLESEEDLLVYIDGGMLYGYNQYTGEEVWRHQIGGSLEAVVGHNRGMRGKNVYCIGDTVYAHFMGSGRERWTAAFQGGMVGSPVLHDGSLYLGTDSGKVHSLDVTSKGENEWSVDLGRTITGRLSVVGGALYAVSAEGSGASTATLHRLDPGSGDVTGSMELGYEVRGGPTVEGGRGYLPTGSGLLALGSGVAPGDLSASLSMDVQEPRVGDVVSFSASPGDAESYDWSFESASRDEVERTGSTVELSFGSEGEWNVTVTVTDSEGRSDTASRSFEVTARGGGEEVTAEGDDGIQGGSPSISSTEDAGGEDNATGGSVSAESVSSEGADPDRLLGGDIPGAEDILGEGGLTQTTVAVLGGVGAATIGGAAGFLAYRKRVAGGSSKQVVDISPDADGDTGADALDVTATGPGLVVGDSVVGSEGEGAPEEDTEEGEGRVPDTDEDEIDTDDEVTEDTGGVDREEVEPTGAAEPEEEKEEEKEEGEGTDATTEEAESGDTPSVEEEETEAESVPEDGAEEGTEDDPAEDADPGSGSEGVDEGTETEATTADAAGRDGDEGGSEPLEVSDGSGDPERDIDTGSFFTKDVCPGCGDYVNIDDDECGSCGADLSGIETCPECGKRIEEGDDACSLCGTSL